MNTDKYSAVWVSHSSISDFLRCPRAYYLKNIYRNPETGNKIKLMNPPLSLGQAVHEVVESLSVLPVKERFRESLLLKYNLAWQKISGKQGGFGDAGVEMDYKKRGEEMLKRLMDEPGPLKNLAVKIKQELPYFWLSPKDNIILCGRIDWLEFSPDTNSVHIIDFKTGRHDENLKSLQLPIYYLLAKNCQPYSVAKASYWYLERPHGLTEKPLPEYDTALDKVLTIAKKIKIARQLGVFKCPHKDGCPVCKPYEMILDREAKFVGTDNRNYDVYILEKAPVVVESVIL